MSKHGKKQPPNTITPTYLKGKCHCQSLSCLSLGRNVLFFVVTVLVCLACPYGLQLRNYQNWQNLQNLQLWHKAVTPTITRKEITVDTKNSSQKYYWISYEYQIQLPYNRTQNFNAREQVDKVYYDRTSSPPASIEIIYNINNPAISYIADRFSPQVVQEAYGSYIALVLAQLVGGGVCLGVVMRGLYNVWLVNQLDQHGKFIMGVVTDMNLQSRPGRGNYVQTDYYITYRYLGYETRFQASERGFKQVRVGHSIKICYIPDKPHISRPYPLKQYCL